MESANIHHQHHQLQDRLAGSSSLPTPSCYGVASSHARSPSQNPNVTLNAGNFNPNYNGFILNSRQKNEIHNHVPPPSSSMIQESGLHWANNAGSFTSQSAHDDINFSKIKEELSESFPRFTDMLNSPSSIEDYHELHTSYMKNEQKGLNYFSAGEFYSNSQNVSSFGNSLSSRGNFSQIYPSINISNLNQSSSATSSSFEMNLQALDLLATSSRFCGNFSQTSHYYNNNNDLGTHRESPPFGRLDGHMQHPRRRPSSSPTKLSSFTNDITEAKRSSSTGSIGPKAAQSAPKKPRLESRISCPPFKVRKEKLGDRIAALQQLVAPFGKADTASVLMEAIGYIKFLQNQVETLSVPYKKSSRNKTSRTTQGDLKIEDVNEEPNQDLRSRGLCLVPLSSMSYVTNVDSGGGGGGGIWPPSPNFGERT